MNFEKSFAKKSEALYPFDERPPPVRGLRTDGPNLRGAVEGGPRRRSLGMAEVRPHGFLADSSDDEQLKVGQRFLEDHPQAR